MYDSRISRSIMRGRMLSGFTTGGVVIDSGPYSGSGVSGVLMRRYGIDNFILPFRSGYGKRKQPRNGAGEVRRLRPLLAAGSQRRALFRSMSAPGRRR